MDLRAYCRSLVRGANTNFYYAFVFLPRDKREAIYAAYAFSRHTDDIVDNASSQEAASRELSLWREELHACYEGRAAQAIALNLQETLKSFPIPRQHFLDLIDGVEMDLTRSRYETFDDLYSYCYRVASAIGLICIEIFGYTNPKTRDYAVNLGIALQLTNILRDIAPDWQQDRIYVPAEDMVRFGYSESDLASAACNAAFREMMAFQCGRTRSYYDAAADLLPEEDRRSLFSAEIMGAIYRRLLERIERIDYNVFEGRVRLSNPSKLGIASGIWLGSVLGLGKARRS